MFEDNYYVQESIQTCRDCVLACELCASACLREPHVEALARCIGLDRSCADICALTARELVRRSPFVRELCALCATACEACAEECARHDHMDHCRNCAVTCRDCAAACRHVAQEVVPVE